VRPSASTSAPALRELRERSAEIRAAILLDERALTAAEPADEELGGRLAELTLALLDAADKAGGDEVGEVEVVSPAGSVYVVRAGGLAVAAVAGRLSLSSLVRYDLRRALAEVEGAAG